MMPVGPGRRENAIAVLNCLAEQTVKPAAIVVVHDGRTELEPLWYGPVGGAPLLERWYPKHEPGQTQPRNIGVRLLRELVSECDHVWFIDSDVLVGPDCLSQFEAAWRSADPAILVGPYDWMPAGQREPMPELRNDPRWPSFDAWDGKPRRGDLSAGLGCFSGNLVWPIDEFERVGGFWNELHHGRCEDGELGLRAVAMDVPIVLVPQARGWHMHHDVNTNLVFERNARDVPMLNARHPWVQGSGIFVADREGKRFEVTCPGCGANMSTAEWWAHAAACGEPMARPVR